MLHRGAPEVLHSRTKVHDEMSPVARRAHTLALLSSPQGSSTQDRRVSRKWIFRRRDRPGILRVPLLLPLPKLPVGSRGRDRERDRMATESRNEWRVSPDPTAFSPPGPTRRW